MLSFMPQTQEKARGENMGDVMVMIERWSCYHQQRNNRLGYSFSAKTTVRRSFHRIYRAC